VAFLRSRERGEGPIKAGPISVFAKFQINGYISVAITAIAFTQLFRLMGFPPRAEIKITFAQLWLIPSEAASSVDRNVHLGILAASEGETTITDAQFYDRFIDYIAIGHKAHGTVGNFTENQYLGRQIWIDELFNTLGGVSLESVPDGIYMFASTPNDVDMPARCVARIHVEMILHQMNYADDYTQNGQRVTEGWAGYEWEEAVGDAMEQGTVDEAL